MLINVKALAEGLWDYLLSRNNQSPCCFPLSIIVTLVVALVVVVVLVVLTSLPASVAGLTLPPLLSRLRPTLYIHTNDERRLQQTSDLHRRPFVTLQRSRTSLYQV